MLLEHLAPGRPWSVPLHILNGRRMRHFLVFLYHFSFLLSNFSFYLSRLLLSLIFPNRNAEARRAQRTSRREFGRSRPRAYPGYKTLRFLSKNRHLIRADLLEKGPCQFAIRDLYHSRSFNSPNIRQKLLNLIPVIKRDYLAQLPMTLVLIPSLNLPSKTVVSHPLFAFGGDLVTKQHGHENH